MSSADPSLFTVAALQSLYRTTRLVTEIQVLEETSSTNDYALRCGEQGHPGGLVVFAERQTQGRGRHGRHWDSQPGQGLWFSILLRPATPLSQWTRYASIAALVVARGIEKSLHAPATAGIKWPNDIYLDGKKAAGILLESRLAEAAGFLVIGIGINVNQTTFPDDLTGIATSLRMVSGSSHHRPAVAMAVLTELDKILAAVDFGFAEIVAACSRRSTLLGKPVAIDIGDRMIEGVAESIDAEGQLVIRCADGSYFAASYGEVS